MPRSVFTATHHRLLRDGAYGPRFRVRELWDLDEVMPLFRVPSCVLFAAADLPVPRDAIEGRHFSGTLPTKEITWAAAEPALTVVDAEYRLRFLGERSAWVRVGAEGQLTGTLGPTRGANAYTGAFRQGAILYPQTLLVISGVASLRRGMGTVAIATDPRARVTAKLLKDVDLRQLVDAENLYSTAAAEHLHPYALAPNLWTVVLPTTSDPGTPGFGTVSPAVLRREGRVHTAAWLEFVETLWATVRKEDETDDLTDRLDYMHQLSSQADRERFLVLYTSSGARPVAAGIDVATLDLPFVVRDKTYWASFPTQSESDFLVAFLNSDFVAQRIEDWQTRGLFGARDVHKRPLDVDWPAYNPDDVKHVELAELGGRLRVVAGTAARDLPNTTTGRQRAWVRGQLSPRDLESVENLVAELSAARTLALLGVIT